MRWKNGLGSTTEIARWPGDDGPDFTWRVSVASVDCSGPFSLFPGYDRILIPLDGGMTLDTEGVRTSIRPLSPHAFPGDVLTFGSPEAGLPVRDLNIMTARGRARATVEILSPGGMQEIHVRRGEVAVFYVAKGSVSAAGLTATMDQTLMANDESSFMLKGDETAKVVLSRIQTVV